MPNTIFSEKVEFYRIFLAALIIPGLLMLIMPFAMANQSIEIRTILPIIGIVLLVLAYFTKTLDIELTDDYLQFGFGMMRSKINLLDIKEVRVEDFKFRNFGGYGVRIGKMNQEKVLGYIPRGGQGLLIRAGKKNYFIISGRANELQSLINDRIRILQKNKPD